MINDWYNNPLIFGKYIFCTSRFSFSKSTLYFFDQDGNVIWNFGIESTSISVLPDFIVVGNESGDVYALQWNESLLWKFETGYDVLSSPALGDLNGDGNLDVVVGSRDDYIYAISGIDGTLLWKFETGYDVLSSPALGDLNGDGNLDVVVGSCDGYIYAISGDGSLLWKFETGYCVYSSPALGDIDGDRYLDLAVASFDGHLYVFESTVKGGKVVWSMFRGDASGTGLYENAVSFAEYNLSGQVFNWYPEF